MDAKEAAILIQNPKVRVMLDLIAAAEGVKHGYSTGFGNTVLGDLKDHPRQSKGFTETTGKKKTTTAAGRYQFLGPTWDDAAAKLKLTDFGPTSQDMAAVLLLERNGALPAVLKGDYSGAVKKAGQTWASLPSSPYAQPKKSQKFIDETLTQLQKNPSSQAGVVAATPVTMKQVAALPPAQPFIDQPPQAMDALPNTDGAPLAPPDWADVVRKAQIAGQQAAPDTTSQPWEDRLMADSLNADVGSARSAAVSQFFGEPVVPQIEMPKQIDDSINRILAKMSA